MPRVALFTPAILETAIGRTMWTRYDHGEKRIRRADIVAIWTIVVGLLLAAAACSGL
jgi:hypothetical protein